MLSVYPVAARLLQGILVFVSIMAVALGIAIKRMKSGVYANPVSIAGLATLFQKKLPDRRLSSTERVFANFESHTE